MSTQSFLVVAFLDPLAGVWLKPDPFIRPAAARDYVTQHQEAGGEIPELDTVMAGEPVPVTEDSYQYARERRSYLVIGVPSEPMPTAEDGYPEFDWEGGAS